MMNKIPVPKNEQGRIAALKLYDILDTAPEQEFDNLAQLAAEICNTPIALINLIDEKKQWTKASVGIALQEMPREFAFCQYTILDDEIFEVNNPLSDPRFENNQLVTGEPGVRFYAGIPLINKDGYRLGSLCVMSPKHHQLNSYQRISLRILTASVMSLLELRRERKDADSYRQTLDEISVVSVLDTHQNLIYANDKFCKMVGLTEDELLGKNISEVKLSDITPDQANSISNSIVERKNWSGVIKNQNIKGIVTWSKLNILPFTNKDGEIFKILNTRQDITQEMLLREQLAASELLAKAGSWELNIFNRQTTWTPGMYALLEFDNTEEKLTEQNIMSFIHPADFDRVNDVNKRMLENKTQVELLEFRIITKKYNEKLISAIVRKRFNSKGGLTGIYGTLMDITDSKSGNSQASDATARYNELYDAAPCGYYSLDAEGYITELNDTFANWLGYRKEEVISQLNLKSILHADSYPFFESSFFLLKKNGSLKDTHVLMKRKNGTSLHTLVNATVINNALGEFSHALYTVQDIDELISLQDMVAANRTHKKEKVAVDDQLQFSMDVDCNVLSASQSLMEITGYDEKELTRTKFAFAADEPSRTEALDFYEKQLHEVVEHTTYTLPAKTKSGDKIWLEITAGFNLLESSITGFNCTVKDVTDKRRNDEELQQVTAKAEAAMQLQQTLLGKVNTDVRNPLGGIVGMINLLSTTALSMEQKVLLGGIKESSALMLRSLDTILEDNKTPFDSNISIGGDAEFEIKTLVNNLIIALKPEADKKNIRFILQVDNKIPATVIADAARLTTILQQLASNALKFTELGSISISVLQKVVARNLITLEFIVKDSGIGMSSAKLESLFGTQPKAGAERSGLQLAKQLIEDQNGILQIKSQPGIGTTLSFTFQCKQANATIAEREAEMARPVVNEVKTKAVIDEKTSLVGYNILLVEDNIMNQRVGRVTVENWGANVTVVDRGKKAVELVTTNKFDVILMDLQMPEMSGIEATELIRNELKINIPILGMTVSEMQGNREMCIKAGMNDYILKPLNPVELHQKIIALINKGEVTISDKIINISYIRNITDGDTDLIREILEIYINRTPALITELDEHISNGDFKQVKAGVHYLKNSVGLLGADTLFHLLATIEDQLNYLPPANDTLILLTKMKEILRQSIVQTEEELNAL